MISPKRLCILSAVSISLLFGNGCADPDTMKLIGLAGVGAAVGALIGQKMGDSTISTVVGAAAGAGLGAVAAKTLFK